MSNTVKIVRFHKTGPAEVLQFDELPLPEPGPGEIRLRVKALGLNRAEVMFRNGQYLETPVLRPRTATRPPASSKPSDQVSIPAGSARPSARFPELSSSTPMESMAKSRLCPCTESPNILQLFRMNRAHPSGCSTLPLMARSSGLARSRRGTLSSSPRPAAALASPRSRWSRPRALSASPSPAPRQKAGLLKLGADHVIVTDEEDLVARVNEITSGKGARIVFDPIGGKILESLAAATAPKGIIFEYGALAPEPTPYPLFTALAKYLTIRAYTVFELTADPVFPKAKQYVFDRLASGAFKPLIDRAFPFEEIVEAHRYMESNAQIGKIVVTV